MPSGQQDGGRDIDLVMVTGAGASREFGVNGAKLPLMGDWCDALVSKLQRHPPYLQATGLARGLAGAEFEGQLGRFLRQVDAIRESRDLLAATATFPNIGQQLALLLQGQGVFDTWYDQVSFHLDEITSLIHESLYEQFAAQATNTFAADACYRGLLQRLGVTPTTSLVYATTNYDAIAEQAIREYGRLPDWGSPPTDQGSAEQPLEVHNLVQGIGRYTPVLHLHGRVGWYRRPDGRVCALQTQQHQKGFGRPIVMLPDPEKVYDKDDVINALWAEFTGALRRAKRVFVLGHSLNDAFLLRALLENVQPYDRIAVTGMPDEIDQSQLAPPGRAVEEKAREVFGQGVQVIPFAFGGKPDSSVPGLDEWNDRLTRGGLL